MNINMNATFWRHHSRFATKYAIIIDFCDCNCFQQKLATMVFDAVLWGLPTSLLTTCGDKNV